MGEREHVVDLASLKALAHPLRVSIVDTLSMYGPATASGLAARLGESSGATSYHLRQLEKHGFVREVQGRGTARERWWERAPGSISLHPHDEEFDASPSARLAADFVSREWANTRERQLRAFMEHGPELPKPWQEASVISTTNVQVTVEELRAFVEQNMAALREFAARHRDRAPGTRPVQIQFHAFPIVDGEEVPGEDPASGGRGEEGR